MAGSVNKVILIGNLGSDPEVRYLESGSAVAKFNIATTESYTNKSGERVDNTEWHRIELWEGLAKVAEKYLKKGNQVYIEGRIRTDSWTDKEGQQRTGVTIRANSMTLLGGPAGSGGGGEGNNGGYAQQSSAPRAGQAPRSSDPIPPSLAAGNDDDDLPF
ncbi:single-stranded DNA-binding protein [Dyadobacter sp. LJ53]|uniref:single-stranded DNA-binding protein n=1 Tax=Dyadobacter chenwenxiniae TaxID=2906456 RepID=UPI001F45CB12|nr:single-stranded DNA-binding protein [Dyadobacter chenwenxiniae]MCF0053030.1 single-stranded DNA-binding protein [Dyadobacter chenwenxiniae]